MEKPCVVCGVRIEKKQNESLKRWIENHKYCSHKCGSIAKIGKKASPEQMAGLRRGWDMDPKLRRGLSPAWNKGKRWSEEVKDKIRAARQAQVRVMVFEKGYLHPNWKGGITKFKDQLRNLRENRAWKAEVRRRGGYTCKQCGVYDHNAQIDHIKPFMQIVAEHSITTLKAARACAELWDVANGQILCEPCHTEKSKSE